MTKILTAYFSRRGENYFDGSIRFLEKGNTEIIAEAISEATGSDLFEIDTLKPYADDYHSCTLEAKEELSQNARPQLAHDLSDLSSYDTIFLGFPNWWGTCPMAIFTFLEGHDFQGKRIIPFCTNEGSGMGRSEKDIARALPKATIEKGLSIPGSEAPPFGKRRQPAGRRSKSNKETISNEKKCNARSRGRSDFHGHRQTNGIWKENHHGRQTNRTCEGHR